MQITVTVTEEQAQAIADLLTLNRPDREAAPTPEDVAAYAAHECTRVLDDAVRAANQRDEELRRELVGRGVMPPDPPAPRTAIHAKANEQRELARRAREAIERDRRAAGDPKTK